VKRSRRSILPVVALAGVLPALAGCYTTTALGTATPDPGARIVAELTSEGRASMTPLIGPDVILVEGTVAAVRPEGLDLLVKRVEQTGGRGSLWNEERVAFPSSAIASMQGRQLDRTRTYLAVAGGVVGALLLGRLIGSDGGFFGGGGGSGEVPPL
jgi:hypothetical protein